MYALYWAHKRRLSYCLMAKHLSSLAIDAVLSVNYFHSHIF